MSPGPTFERVYRELRRRLLDGEFAPGAHLEPTRLGGELNASITPVRDALHRLVGERLIDAPKHNGFEVPLMSEAELRDLYGWCRTLILLALSGPSDAGPGSPHPSAASSAPDDAAPAAADLFREIGRSTASHEHRVAIAQAIDRLAGAARAEQHVFADLNEETERLRHWFARGELVALKKGIAGYFRRRQRRVEQLVAILRRPAPANEVDR